jgi:hypothetical protein
MTNCAAPKSVCLFLLLTLGCPLVGASEPWRFIITGDSRGSGTAGVNTVIMTELASEILKADVDFVLFSGDLIYGSQDPLYQLSQWLLTMQPVYDAQIPVYVIRGNHEDFGNTRTAWQQTFTGPLAMPSNGPSGEENLTWSFNHRNALVVGIDQYVNILQINQPWLDAQLAQNSAPHVFVMGHAPAFEVRDRAYPLCSLDYYPQQRDAFWQSLRNAGAMVYFCSHDHMYNHAVVSDNDPYPDNNIHQYVVGTAGAPPYSWSGLYAGDNSSMTLTNIAHGQHYGYLLVEVDGLDVTLTYMARDSLDLQSQGVYEPNDTYTYSIADIKLISPNGGEKIVASSDYTIAWQTRPSAQIQDVLLEYYDGTQYHAINDAPLPADAGAYLWSPVSAIDSPDCLIRISDWNNPASNDISDDPFTIFNCTLASPSDFNNDCYVNFQDLVIFAFDWLRCGNSFDPACL